MSQDLVERRVFIFAHYLLNAAYSNGLQIRKRTSQSVTDSIYLRST